MRECSADLHVHTALSPCAEEGMTPPAMVERAVAEGLNMIAVCDHNTAANAEAVQTAAGGAIAAIAGIEITTTEEVHVLGLFPDADRASEVGRRVLAGLPVVDQAYRAYCRQSLLSADGRVVGDQNRMLSVACSLDLADAVGLIHEHGGLAVAAHVDRPAFGVIGQLGLFPADVGFDAVEVSGAGARSGWRDRVSALGLPVISSSDSHFLSDIGSARSHFVLESACFAELVLAMKGACGRSCLHA